ncbi:MAG TPA: hypothetical protein VN843_13250, partial [Anaerolineales bacterium]|nr:hypothetical protein [Anaerolineales bacterium]
MALEKEFHGPNLAYILELHQRYLNDPNSVDDATRKLFEGWSPDGAELTSPLTVSNLSTPSLLPLTGAMNLAQAVRSYGYLSANLDPLGGVLALTGDPILTLKFHHLQKEDLLNLPAEILNLPSTQPVENAHQAIEILLSIYCGTIGYDYGHIRIPEERNWLYQTAETGRYRPPQQAVDEKQLLERLTQIEAFELFLHRIYPGKTRFSIEGLDMLIPMLDEIIASASDEKIHAVLMGMAHRGRLNVLAHILQKPYSQILAEFSDPKGRATTWDELGWTGDVKYHMGAYRSLGQDKDFDMHVHMPPNPSHLEQ